MTVALSTGIKHGFYSTSNAIFAIAKTQYGFCFGQINTISDNLKLIVGSKDRWKFIPFLSLKPSNLRANKVTIIRAVQGERTSYISP